MLKLLDERIRSAPRWLGVMLFVAIVMVGFRLADVVTDELWLRVILMMAIAGWSAEWTGRFGRKREE